MSYRLKNSDFKLFLGVFDRKVSDLYAHVGEGIDVHFGMFLSGKSVPGGRDRGRECDGVLGWDKMEIMMV